VTEQHYVLRDGTLEIVDEHIERTRWTQTYYDARLPRLYASFDHEGCGWTVLTPTDSGDRMVAISVLDGRWIGAGLDMLDLTFIHVTRALRGRGLGGPLLDRSAELARARGAKRLYVSASNSRKTVDFYLRRGLQLAAAPDPALHAIGPTDIHLELLLNPPA